MSVLQRPVDAEQFDLFLTRSFGPNVTLTYLVLLSCRSIWIKQSAISSIYHMTVSIASQKFESWVYQNLHVLLSVFLTFYSLDWQTAHSVFYPLTFMHWSLCQTHEGNTNLCTLRVNQAFFICSVNKCWKSTLDCSVLCSLRISISENFCFLNNLSVCHNLVDLKHTMLVPSCK